MSCGPLFSKGLHCSNIAVIFFTFIKKETMLSHLQADDLLFLDIETVPDSPSYEETEPDLAKTMGQESLASCNR